MLKNEIFVRFILTDFQDDFAHITNYLGIQPTKTWKVNDLKTKKGTIKHKTNGWELSLNSKDVLHVDETLKKLIQILSPAKKKILLMDCISKTISIVIYAKDGMPSISYDLETISFINEIKATIDQDIYCLK